MYLLYLDLISYMLFIIIITTMINALVRWMFMLNSYKLHTYDILHNIKEVDIRFVLGSWSDGEYSKTARLYTDNIIITILDDSMCLDYYVFKFRHMATTVDIDTNMLYYVPSYLYNNEDYMFLNCQFSNIHVKYVSNLYKYLNSPKIEKLT